MVRLQKEVKLAGTAGVGRRIETSGQAYFRTTAGATGTGTGSLRLLLSEGETNRFPWKNELEFLTFSIGEPRK